LQIFGTKKALAMFSSVTMGGKLSRPPLGESTLARPLLLPSPLFVELEPPPVQPQMVRAASAVRIVGKRARKGLPAVDMPV
jgi:hypothetical protein